MNLRQTNYCWQGVAIRLTAQCANAASTLLFSAAVGAQIVPDATLPVNSIVTPNGNILTIEGGSRLGGNLFHSFTEFSLTTGSEAFFNNAADVQNIFSRITGSNISNIDGLIRANGTANLFLLNPNGIIFGPNAQLNIGGSFVGSTANSIKFADSTNFSATNPTVAPLLTISVPIGLQMGQNPRGITVQGSGHRLGGNLFTPSDRSQNPIGLQVSAGNTLALIGGEINFSGGIVAVDGGGHLEIGSVSDGQVRLNPTRQGWVGDYSAVGQFNDIHLAQRSLLDASGSSGSIQLQGRNINLTEGSAALIQNLAAKSSGGITVSATESLNLTGNTPDAKLGSLIQIDNLGTTLTGDITISAAQLSIQNGGQITNQTFTSAPSGNITVNVAGLIDIEGFAYGDLSRNSAISTVTFSDANAGNITVSTGNMRFLNGGVIASVTVGSGQAGRIQVNAEDLIEIVGNASISLSPSSINSLTFSASGNANNTLIDTSRLVIRDGGFLGSLTVAAGAAGSVTVNASKSVDIGGRTPGSILPSRIASTAEILDPANQAAFGFPPIPTGNAGSLTINTPSLRIADGAYITVKNDGPGRAGDLQINANSIVLDNQGVITASTTSGNGGDIRLNLQASLLIRHGSLISATAAGAGNGGNLSINAPIAVGLENSDIIANAFQGKGGNIQISTQGIFGLENRPQLTPQSDISASSQYGVSGRVNVSVLNVNQQNVVAPPPSNFVNTDQVVANSCLARIGNSQGTFVITGNGGLPETPETETIPYEVVQVRAAQTPQATPRQQESKATPTATSSWKPGDPIVEATEFSVNAQGQVVLTANGNTGAAAIAQPQPIPCQPN